MQVDQNRAQTLHMAVYMWEGFLLENHVFCTSTCMALANSTLNTREALHLQVPIANVTFTVHALMHSGTLVPKPGERPPYTELCLSLVPCAPSTLALIAATTSSLDCKCTKNKQ